MIARSERAKKIELFEKEFSNSRGIYFTDIHRLDVEKITQLRAELRRNGLKYIVVKNSLARIALERCGKQSMCRYLSGATGAVLAAEEATAPARVIRGFHKNNKDLLAVRAAYVDGTIVEGEQLERLADIPSRDVLLSQLLSCLKAPVSNLAGVLDGILVKLVGTLEAVKRQRESAE
jgi:large subunit ribosomal protein L10